MSPAKLNTAFKVKDTSIENVMSKNLPEYFICSRESNRGLEVPVTKAWI
jgi:hypothetical protein